MTRRIAAEDLRALLGRQADLQILDVRERGEWDSGHVPNSVFAPWHDITGVPRGIDPQRPIAVICSSGQRAGLAASLLRRHGADRVLHVVDGGVATWARLGNPLKTELRSSGAPA